MAQDSPRLSRKQAIREYKERKTPRGIFAVRCASAQPAWVESSPNLNSARNSVWFTLRQGNHPNRTLQTAWNEHGEQAFTFEVLEQLEDETPNLNLADVLKKKKLDWIQRLSARCMF